VPCTHRDLLLANLGWAMRGFTCDALYSLFAFSKSSCTFAQDGVVSHKWPTNEQLPMARVFRTTSDSRVGAFRTKFDVIVENPPRQLSTGSRSQCSPIYHKFVECAISLNPRFILVITPFALVCWRQGSDKINAHSV